MLFETASMKEIYIYVEIVKKKKQGLSKFEHEPGWTKFVFFAR